MHLFTLQELEVAFKPFIDRLVDEHGNDRQAMVDYHLTKLVDLPLSAVLSKMPRGPRGHWADMMSDIRQELRDMAS